MMTVVIWDDSNSRVFTRWMFHDQFVKTRDKVASLRQEQVLETRVNNCLTAASVFPQNNATSTVTEESSHDC